MTRWRQPGVLKHPTRWSTRSIRTLIGESVVIIAGCRPTARNVTNVSAGWATVRQALTAKPLFSIMPSCITNGCRISRTPWARKEASRMSPRITGRSMPMTWPGRPPSSMWRICCTASSATTARSVPIIRPWNAGWRIWKRRPWRTISWRKTSMATGACLPNRKNWSIPRILPARRTALFSARLSIMICWTRWSASPVSADRMPISPATNPWPLK